jgi:competence protein ComEC
VLRAALMGLIALLALALGRPRSALPALLGSATLLVLADPDLALAPGFVLSVLATGSLLLVAPGWVKAFEQRMPRWAAQALAIPLAAQAAVTPVVVLLSGSISLVAVPANLLAAPAVPVATIFGVLTAVLFPVSPWLARLSARAAGLPCSWVAAVAHRSARVPGGSIAWPHTLIGALLAAFAVALVVASTRRRRSRRLLVAAVLGIVLAGLLVPHTIARWPLRDWKVIACDVGQGDALLVRGAVGEAPVLIDAGPDPRLLRTCLHTVGIHRLSAVVLSHLHADHVEGLPGVLGEVPAAGLFVNPLDEPALEGRRVRGWAANAHVPVGVLNAGQHWSAGGVMFDVIGPAPVLHGTDSDPNNDSLVLLAVAAGLRILLTGDVEPEAQANLLAHGVPMADVFKVPHHGSAHQDDAFLGASGARIALTSVGRDNPYGHPAPETLAVIRRDGMLPMRTDVDGAVALAGEPGDARVLPQKQTDSPRLQAAGPRRMQQQAASPARVLDAGELHQPSEAGSFRAVRGAWSTSGTPRPRARSPPWSAPERPVRASPGSSCGRWFRDCPVALARAQRRRPQPVPAAPPA